MLTLEFPKVFRDFEALAWYRVFIYWEIGHVETALYALYILKLKKKLKNILMYPVGANNDLFRFGKSRFKN